MQLPNAENAMVEISKLRDYSLNAEHERGAHKAKVFYSALGITAKDAEWLKAQTLTGILGAEAEENAPSIFGRRFKLDLIITRAERVAWVRTTWIIEYGTEVPRLTSCYVV